MADQPTSMADDIRAAMAEVSEKVEETPVEPVVQEPTAEPAPVETEAAKAERLRDEAGRFAKGEEKRETLKLKPKETPNAPKEPERKAQEPANQASAAQAPKPEATQVSPPPHWKGGAKVDWNKLPATVRESIAEDHKHVAAVMPIKQAVAQYEERFQREFGGTDRALGTILGAWQFARQSPVEFAKQFVQQYNIDPHALVAGNPGQQPVQGLSQEQQLDPALAPIMERLQRAETALQQFAQQPVLQQQRQIETDIQKFQTAMKPDGSVAHPHFNDVKAHMGALMTTPGGPQSLDEAYEQACWANPQVRASLIAAHQASQESERRAAIARAQGAAVSVSGAPGVNGAHRAPMQSVSDELRAVMAEAKGGRA